MDTNLPCLDNSVLDTLAKAIGPEKQRGFIKNFIRDLEQRSIAMHAAYDKQRWDNLENDAHILTSAAGTYGAKQLQQICAQIEECCTNNEYDKISAIMEDTFIKLTAQTRYVLQCYLQQMTA